MPNFRSRLFVDKAQYLSLEFFLQPLLFQTKDGDFLRVETYKPYTLVGPTVTRQVQDPLAVTSLDNRLKMLQISSIFHNIAGGAFANV